MKIQSPWMGRVRGSAGNMTGCKVYDKNVMRAKAFEVSNPNTAAQQVQRGYFANLIKLVAGFSPEQLRTLFPNMPKAMSRRNALTKQLAEYYTMEGTEKVIDFANIDTLGNAPTDTLYADEVVKEEGFYYVGWSIDELPSSVKITDFLVVLLINETKGEIFFNNESSVAENGDIDIHTGNIWDSNDSVHAILFSTNMQKKNQAFGSFIIKVRPGKKSN